MDDFMKEPPRRKVKSVYPQITQINADEILLPPSAAESRAARNHNLRNLRIKIFGFNFAPWRLCGPTSLLLAET
jgi:hypothetical protein